MCWVSEVRSALETSEIFGTSAAKDFQLDGQELNEAHREPSTLKPKDPGGSPYVSEDD